MNRPVPDSAAPDHPTGDEIAPDDPGRASLAVSRALRVCWASLPEGVRTVAAAEREFRRLCERALRDLREDAAAFPPERTGSGTGSSSAAAFASPPVFGADPVSGAAPAPPDPVPGRVPEDETLGPIDLDALERGEVPPSLRPDWGGPTWHDVHRPAPPKTVAEQDDEPEDPDEGPTYRLTGG